MNQTEVKNDDVTLDIDDDETQKVSSGSRTTERQQVKFATEVENELHPPRPGTTQYENQSGGHHDTTTVNNNHEEKDGDASFTIEDDEELEAYKKQKRGELKLRCILQPVEDEDDGGSGRDCSTGPPPPAGEPVGLTGSSRRSSRLRSADSPMKVCNTTPLPYGVEQPEFYHYRFVSPANRCLVLFFRILTFIAAAALIIDLISIAGGRDASDASWTWLITVSILLIIIALGTYFCRTFTTELFTNDDKVLIHTTQYVALFACCYKKQRLVNLEDIERVIVEEGTSSKGSENVPYQLMVASRNGDDRGDGTQRGGFNRRPGRSDELKLVDLYSIYNVGKEHGAFWATTIGNARGSVILLSQTKRTNDQ